MQILSPYGSQFPVTFDNYIIAFLLYVRKSEVLLRKMLFQEIVNIFENGFRLWSEVYHINYTNEFGILIHCISNEIQLIHFNYVIILFYFLTAFFLLHDFLRFAKI